MAFFKNRRRLALLGIDFAIIAAVYALTLLISLLAEDGVASRLYIYFANFFIFAFAILSARVIVGIYSSVWRFANSFSFLKLVIADCLGGCLAVVITKIAFLSIGSWKECTFVCMLNIVTLVSRFVYQHKYRRRNLEDSNTKNSEKIPVAIVGAGQIGSLLAEELCTGVSRLRSQDIQRVAGQRRTRCRIRGVADNSG